MLSHKTEDVFQTIRDLQRRVEALENAQAKDQVVVQTYINGEQLESFVLDTITREMRKLK